MKTPAIGALLAICAPVFSSDAGVEIRVEDRTYPVVTNASSRAWQVCDRLRDKDAYTTGAVVMENEYLCLVVLPEFGGRLVEVKFKPTNQDLFWRCDSLRDRGPGRMGGGQWSFPFWEHCRHFDETTGYTIVRHADGGATLAMDMRFDGFLKPEETGRYGRATNLRLVQTVRLNPGQASCVWSARVDNPLPIRYGFKLWWLLRQNAQAGIKVLMPTAAVTGHGAPGLVPWDQQTTIRTGLVNSVFSIGIRHDFAGWYLPETDMNVLRLQDHRIAPGAKQVLYQPSPIGYIEMWGGNNEVFEECGRILPAFGAYENKLTILPALGIGKADYANEDAVVSCRRKEDRTAWEVKVVTTRDLEGATLNAEGVVEAGAETANAGERAHVEPRLIGPIGRIGPTNVLRAVLSMTSERVRLALRDKAGRILLDREFPLDVGPMPEAEFPAVQARAKGTMPGSKGLYAEATDLTSEHQFHLPHAAGLNTNLLAASEDSQTLLDAARQLMRVRKNSSEALAGLDKVLAREPNDPHANLYKAIWLLESGRPDDAFLFLAKTGNLPGGRYLLALASVAKKNHAQAEEHLRSLLAMPPEAAFRGENDPGLALLQRGAVISATRPRLLLAIVLGEQGKKEEADAVLRKLVDDDPALIEAWMILGDSERLKTLTGKNASGRTAAERTVDALRAGRWEGIGKP